MRLPFLIDEFIDAFVDESIRKGDEQIIDMRDAKGNTPLHLACKAGLVSCVKKLLAYPVDVNAVNHDGRSIIHEARQAMKSCCPSEAEEIAQCINLVAPSGGVEHPDSPQFTLLRTNTLYTVS